MEKDFSLNQNTLPTTIEDCHTLIRNLMSLIDKQGMELKKQHAEIQLLKEQLTINSQNSSLPPSHDLKKKKKKSSKHPSGRASGGQPGHPGHYRKMLDSTEADTITVCAAPKDCTCGGAVVENGNYQCHQVYELPVIKLHMTEYQLAEGICNHCSKKHVAPLPEGITWGITGPRLTSFMSEMVAGYHLSRRQLQNFLKNHFHFDIGLGTVFNKEKIVNDVLTVPTQEIKEEIHKSPFANMDETSHNRDGKKQWLWAALTATAA